MSTQPQRGAGRSCDQCKTERAVLRRPKNNAQLCKACFFELFEAEVHATITENALFSRGQRVAIAASGGKDSTVLAHIMSVLNLRHDYGLDLFLLSIDEGITGYRDDSLECVRRNRDVYALPLRVVSYRELYGWTMDEVVSAIGKKNNCTFCGVFRRQALDRGASLVGADCIVTGHNADDIAETVLMNLLRGDVARLGRCVNITTGVTSATSSQVDRASSHVPAPSAIICKEAPVTHDIAASAEGALVPKLRIVPRCKPLKYAYEKEIVLYAYHKRLDYHSTECVYSPHAYRGFAREFLKDLEAIRPRAIIDLIRSAESWRVEETQDISLNGSDDDAVSVRTGATSMSRSSGATAKLTAASQTRGSCARCGYMTSRGVDDDDGRGGCGAGASGGHLPPAQKSDRPLGRFCQACTLLEGLRAGMPRVGIVSDRQARRMTGASAAKETEAAVPER